MNDARNCPKCHLLNPPSAERCDCGYDFASGSIEKPYLAEPASRYHGVGGWLLFFILTLTIFNPAGFAFVVRDLIVAMQSGVPRVPFLSAVFGILSVLTIGLAACSLYVGIRLWQIAPKAVRMAKLYLILFFLVQLAEIVVRLAAAAPSEVGAVIPIIGILVYSLVWYQYLNTSSRVRSTYGWRR